MTIKIKGRRTFKVNGKEYGSVDGMPPPIRAAYERLSGR
jgi:hypothetical protein